MEFMELVGKIFLICLALAMFMALAFLVKCVLFSAAESEETENESQEQKPKLEPPTEGTYYTSKQDSMISDEELQQLDEKGWELVNIIPETYHTYLGTFPEAPRVERTRYIYVFKRNRKEA